MGTKFQASIYDLKRREEDFELAPAVKHLSGLYVMSEKPGKERSDEPFEHP